jgi:hypothetical protein
MATNRVTVDGLTDALVLFAIGMVLARVIRFARVLRKPRTSGTGPTLRPPVAHAWTPDHS